MSPMGYDRKDSSVVGTLWSQPTTLSETPQSGSTGARETPDSTTGFSLSLGTDLTAATDPPGVGT